MLGAVEVKRPVPGDDEEDLLPAVAAALERATRREADHPLLEVLAALRGVDRGADLGGISGRAGARNVLLRYDEAL